MKVKIAYFKDNGKYYTEAEYESTLTRDDGLYRVWEEIDALFEADEWPGLVPGIHFFHALIEVPEHPHNHPRMIIHGKDIAGRKRANSREFHQQLEDERETLEFAKDEERAWMEFGHGVRLLRIGAGFTMGAVARRLGLCVSTVSALEVGRSLKSD